LIFHINSSPTFFPQFFVVSSVFSDLPKTLETAKFCYNKWFDWSNISILQYWPQSCLVLFRHVGMSSRVLKNGKKSCLLEEKSNVWKFTTDERRQVMGIAMIDDLTPLLNLNFTEGRLWEVFFLIIKGQLKNSEKIKIKISLTTT
jgi:hypothetical protein